MTQKQSQGAPTDWDGLPEKVKTYLTAHAANEGGSALDDFAPDAIVTDEGHDYTGRDEIETWLTDSAGEFTYTTEFTSATMLDVTSVDVVQRLEGNFPGGVADLHFRFSTDGGLITQLVIEP